MGNKSQEISDYLTYGQMNLINDSRYNVLQMAMWARAYVNALDSGFGSLEGNTKKLFSIPTLFYNSLKPYMGEVIAEEYQNLVFKSILTFTKIVNALRNGDTQEVDRNIAEWYQNADEMATFLAERNLYWDREQWRYLLYGYLDLTLNETIAILSDEFEKGIDIYDRIQYHALIMADYMSRGLISNLKQMK